MQHMTDRPDSTALFLNSMSTELEYIGLGERRSR